MRSWVIGPVPATLVGVAVLSLGMAGSPYPAAAQQRSGVAGGGVETPPLVGSPRPAAAGQSERLAVVSGYFDAQNRADVDESLSAFADNAVFIGVQATGGCSQQTPCADLVGIRRQLEGNVAIHLCQTIRSVEVSGAVVLGQLEARRDTSRANGVERELRSFIAQIPNDKITFFAVVSDTSDPQTAFALAANAGTQAPRAPLPSPETPCAGV